MNELGEQGQFVLNRCKLFPSREDTFLEGAYAQESKQENYKGRLLSKRGINPL